MKLDHDLETLPNGAPRRGGPKRFNWRRFRKFALLSVLIVAVLAGGTAVYVYKFVEHSINDTHNPGIHVTQDDKLPPMIEFTRPVNILVVGSDARDVVEGGDKNLRQFNLNGAGGKRSDTMMLIHLTNGGKKAVAMSFPRDLRVKIHGQSHYSKLNGSYNGGPNLVMQTITDLTGIKIDHYVEINFSAFEGIVNAIGGVNLCVKRAYDDPQSGLYVKKPGCYNFDGNKALAYVRMRKQDPDGDFGRIARQQTFMRTLLSKVKSIGFLIDIPRVLNLATAVKKGLQTDPGISLSLIRTVASKLAGYGASNVDFRQVPSRPEMIDGASYVVADDTQAAALYAALRDDSAMPPYGKTGASLPQPADVLMDIQNGSGVNGAGKAWSTKLKGLGYRVRLIKSAPKDRQITQIAYVPGADLKAQLLLEQFPGAQMVQSVNLGSVVDCVVVIGRDHGAEAMPSPSGSAAPASASG